MLQTNNILRKYIKTTEFEIRKIPYLIHRLPKDSVSSRIVDDIDVIFLRKNIQHGYIVILPLLSILWWLGSRGAGSSLLCWASLVAQPVKNLPAMQETAVWFLGWEDPLEKGTSTQSSILAWRIPWTLKSMGLQRVGHYWVTFTSTFHFVMSKFQLSVFLFRYRTRVLTISKWHTKRELFPNSTLYFLIQRHAIF